VEPSEAALLTRLHWWTVEYGLVGDLGDYRIFGAGLLSSLGESQSCLNDRAVRKLPLTVNAVNVPYDITNTQPQLFVTRSCKHLSQVLDEFAASMAFHRGGADGLRRAIDAATVCTAEYDSGVQVSGRITEVLTDAVGNVTYLRTEGPTQLAWRDSELYGHGIDYHREGFGSPVGLLKDFSRCLSGYTFDELKAHRIIIDERVRLEFLSGITVEGILRAILRQEHRNLLLTFDDCRVVDLDGRVLFDPAWGTYDMAVGGRIVSVFGGVADRERYQLYKPLPSTTTHRHADDPGLMALYALLETLERGGEGDARGTALWPRRLPAGVAAARRDAAHLGFRADARRPRAAGTGGALRPGG
jgi:phenylalanine-4-hydroxylase